MHLIVNIPENSKCLLTAGQIVDFDTPYLENTVTKDVIIHVSKKLGIASDKIFNYLKKFVGDSVEKNDIVAEKKRLVGKTSILASAKGIIKEINHHNGEMLLSAFTSQTGAQTAYFKGEVIEVNEKQVQLKVADLQEFSAKFVSSDFGGKTFYLKKLSESIIAVELSDKIMISESITPYIIAKSEALGVTGFISLKNPPVESLIAKAQIKNIEDFKKILNLNLPYCLIDKQYSKIYFYK